MKDYSKLILKAESLLEPISQGSWKANSSEVTMNNSSAYRFGDRNKPAVFFTHQMRLEDAEFVENAPQLVRELIAAVSELEKRAI